jgi:hypothetical protein
MIDHNSSFEERCEELIYRVFGGTHRLRAKPIKEYGPKQDPCSRWTLKIGQRELSTYDDDLLTKLVIASHQYAVRATILTAGMHLRIILWERKRDGQLFFEKHPTLEVAVEAFNKIR